MTVLKVVAAASMAAALATLITVGAFAADPSPTPRAQTCAERYPAGGPGGVDRRLGCIVSELVGHYAGGGTGEPLPIRSYLGPLFALVGGFALLFVAFRYVLGRGQRRMAAAAPTEWWLCPACHSVNGAGGPRCYGCGQPWSPAAKVMPTADNPELVQRFGGDRKSASDRPGRGPDAPPP